MKSPISFVVPGQEAFEALLGTSSCGAAAARCGGSGRCPSPKSAPRRLKPKEA